jgi:hypothetical protein
VLDVDPHPVELVGGTEIVDHVWVEHPTHGEDVQSLLGDESLFERIVHDWSSCEIAGIRQNVGCSL